MASTPTALALAMTATVAVALVVTGVVTASYHEKRFSVRTLLFLVAGVAVFIVLARFLLQTF
jgi:zinc transporter ZupT